MFLAFLVASAAMGFAFLGIVSVLCAMAALDLDSETGFWAGSLGSIVPFAFSFVLLVKAASMAWA